MDEFPTQSLNQARPPLYLGQEGWASSHPGKWRHRAVVTWLSPSRKALTARAFCGAPVTAFNPYPFRADIPDACKTCVANLGQPFVVPPNLDEVLEAYAMNERLDAERTK
jgi:hypothetical protein